MKKELEALNELRFEGLTEEYRNKCCDIVETALKRLEKIETTTHSVLRDDISKKLKAFEIIKDNKINGLELVWYKGMWFVFVPNCPRAIMYGTRKEDYDLLKEVFS